MDLDPDPVMDQFHDTVEEVVGDAEAEAELAVASAIASEVAGGDDGDGFGRFTGGTDFNLLTITDAKPDLPALSTAVMNALTALPTVRNAVVRASRTANTRRPSNLEALLGQMVGTIRPGCTHCTRATRGVGGLCYSRWILWGQLCELPLQQ
jgi:hypothetical protein